MIWKRLSLVEYYGAAAKGTWHGMEYRMITTSLVFVGGPG